MEFITETLESPLGSMEVITHAHQVVSLDFLDCHDRMERFLQKSFGGYQLHNGRTEICDRLQDYFDGDLGALTGIPYLLYGTPFQKKVWQALTEILPGTSLTYGDLARKIGQPKAAQAVGRANSLNPILLVIPCHRVLGKGQQLTGYSAGIYRKDWLLNHERRHCDSPRLDENIQVT